MVVVSSTFSVPAEGVLYQSPSTKLLVNDKELGTATLYITENNVIWGGGVNPSGESAPTISLLYPTISLHAIQREPNPALYMVLNYELRLPELSNPADDAQDQDDDEDFEGDEHPITQLRFIPQNESDLNPLYSAMSHGQALHPDPADEADDDFMDGEDFDDDEFEDAEEAEASPEAAAERLRALRLATNGTHFEDCEDTEAGQE